MNDPANDRFFCLLGGDGSGKSTLLDALAIRCPDIVTVNWKQLSSVTLLPELLPGLSPHDTLRCLGPRSRAAQFCYLAALEYEMMIEPALAEGKTVVVDSYWYKFVAKMEVLEMAAPFLEPLCQTLPRPGHIVYLDTPVALALERKSDINFFECNGDVANFMPFQRAIRETMLEYVAAIPLTRIDGRLSARDMLAQAMDVFRAGTTTAAQPTMVPRAGRAAPRSMPGDAVRR
ncbi:hypothetical protein RBA41_27825 [Massilia sp. CCM 9210]|uniref:dTMP kinase n=1 Tax=Massilia scottii TaxID=3057166 RepID=UPI0027965356|nr:hypothetical protein [Massilia sp. CCM 9210]MDQ1817121.1 hypothetical protein [Massilia sp. CCM 9210]